MPETPSPSERNQRLERILADYLHAVEAGSAPDRAQLLEQHPDLAADLDSFFCNRDAMERIALPIKEQLPALAETIGPSEPRAAAGTTVRYFGDYELLEEIARGGMGVVYRARQVSLNRIVAVKMILAGQLASEGDLQRFKTEAEAAAGLDDPHIVPIYEVGEYEGQRYFSMKLIEGGSLGQAMAGDKWPVRSKVVMKWAAQLLVTVVRSVHHAHQRGILHRDLKPANILLDSAGQPHITDFGLAKRVEGAPGVTQSGVIVGTPGYMAPEQVRAEKQLTTAVDVYGLGAILYEMLTGRPPFQAKTPLDTLMQVLERDPLPPRLIHREIDRDLETICLKCLEKDPQKRYGSAELLAEDLERLLAGRPIRARPVRVFERGVKWAKRQPAMAALVGVGVAAGLLFLIGLAVSFVLIARKNQELTEKHRETAAALERETQTAYYRNVALARHEWQSGDVARADQILGQCPRELRGWEWHYVRRLCHSDLLTIRGHTGSILSVAFGPDGQRLVSGGEDRAVRVWDAATGKELLTLRGHTHRVQCVTVSANGRWIASASGWSSFLGGQVVPSEVIVWNADTGEQLFSLPDNHGVRSVAFSPDNKSLAAITEKGAQLWDMDTRKEIRTLPGAQRALGFSRDGKRLAAATGNGEVTLWEVATGKELRTLAGHLFDRDPSVVNAVVFNVPFNPTREQVAAACYDKIVRLWDTSTGREQRIFHGHADAVTAVAFDPHTSLATGSYDRTVRVWDTQSGHEKVTLRGHTAAVESVAFSPDGQRLASAGGGPFPESPGEIRIWDPTFAQEYRLLRGIPFHLFLNLSLSPDGKLLAIGGAGQSEVTVHETHTGREVHSARHEGRLTGVVFRDDGKLLAFSTTPDKKNGQVWDPWTGKVVCTLEGGLDPADVPDADGITHFSPDGSRLAMSGRFGEGGQLGQKVVQAVVWDTATGRKLFTAGGAGEENLRNLVFSPNGQWLAGWPEWRGVQKGVEVRDATTGLIRLSVPKATFHAFSPDGQYLAIARGNLGQAEVWQVATGAKLCTVPTPKGGAAMVFSPESRHLAIAGRHGAGRAQVQIWTATTGEEVQSLQGYSRGSTSEGVYPSSQQMAFSLDGRRLLTAVEDGTIRLWDTATGQEVFSLRGHRDPGGLQPVPRVLFSRDGNRLFSVGFDQTLRIWDATPMDEKPGS